MTLEEAHKLTLVILKQVMEEKLNEHNVQLAQVRLRSPFSLYLRASLLAGFSVSASRSAFH